jgi:hypothetical protein
MSGPLRALVTSVVVLTGCGSATEVCAPDLEDVGGECLPQCPAGTLRDGETATCALAEAAEPNDFAESAQGVDLPAIGTQVVVNGCVTPYRDLDEDDVPDADYDVLLLGAVEPSLVRIQIESATFAPGFLMLADDEQLRDAKWGRFSAVPDFLRHTDHTVYLPVAGAYALGITHARSVEDGIVNAAPFPGIGHGDAASCYRAIIERVALPEPTALPARETSEIQLAPRFLRVDPGEGGVVTVSADTSSREVEMGITLLLNGELFSVTGVRSVLGDPKFAPIDGVQPGDELVAVIETAARLTPSAVELRLAVDSPTVLPLPAAQSTLTLPNDGQTLLFFDVEEPGDLARFRLSQPAAIGIAMRVFRPRFEGFSSLCGGAGDPDCTRGDQTFQFQAPGRYYVGVEAIDDAPGTYEVLASVTAIRPTTVELGVPLAGATSANGTEYYRIDASKSKWLSVGAAPAGTRISLAVFDGAANGNLDNAVETITLTAATGAVGVGRVLRDPSYATKPQLLVRALNSPAPAVGTPYELRIANRTFTELGEVSDTKPVRKAAIAIGANATQFFQVKGAAAGYLLDLAADGLAAEGLTLTVLNTREVAQGTGTGAAGAAATLQRGVDATLLVEFSVTETLGVAGTYDLRIDGIAPVDYTISDDPIAFVSVCPADGGAGEVHALAPDSDGDDPADEGLSAAPLSLAPITGGFSYFGLPVTAVVVTSNGWFSFDTTTTTAIDNNHAIPDLRAPRQVVAPQWTDLRDIQVCTRVTATEAVVQWRGNEVGTGGGAGLAVEFQAVLHADGRIDFVYGPNNAMAGRGATIGIEAPTGLVAEQIAFDTANSAKPNTAYTLTPKP